MKPGYFDTIDKSDSLDKFKDMEMMRKVIKLLILLALISFQGCSLQGIFLNHETERDAQRKNDQPLIVEVGYETTDSLESVGEMDSLYLDEETELIIKNIETMLEESSYLCDSLAFTEAAEMLEEALKLLSDIDVEAEEDAYLFKRSLGLQESFITIYRKILAATGYLPGESPLTVLLRVPSEERGEVKHWPDNQLKEIFLEIGKNCDIKPVYNNRVRRAIENIQGRNHDAFALWYRRSGKYLSMIREIFNEMGIPQDMAYLAMIESGFNPRAWSRARAAGLWQFIQSTGRLYNLDRNWYVDERFDPEKSTRAAARHLLDLFKMFDNWDLALAAYNAGPQRVKRALNSQRVDSYWELGLVWETYNYVPLFYAAMIISKAPEIFGFDDVKVEEPLQYVSVQISESADLKTLALCAGMTEAELRALNPELRRSFTPPLEAGKSGSSKPTYKLNVAKGSGDSFLANFAKVPVEKKAVTRIHIVRRGETLGVIARRYRVSATAIARLNGIRNVHRIYPGRRLRIPGRYTTSTQVASASSGSKNSLKTSHNSPIYHVVRRGENLWLIARKYNIDLSTLKNFNNLSGRATIYPGTRLIINQGISTASKTNSRKTDFSSKVSVIEGETIIYTVKRGDTLSEIAERHNIGLSVVMRANNISNPRSIKVGTKLRLIIPRRIVSTAGSVKTAELKTISGGSSSSSEKTMKRHIVKRGDTLWEIAILYGVSQDIIARTNNLKNPRRLDIGQVILIPYSKTPTVATTTEPVLNGEQRHTITNGETLYSIARKYNTTVKKIQSRNRIRNTRRIYPGQSLVIPAN